MITSEEKQEIVKLLMAARQKAIDMEIVLRFSGRGNDADQVDIQERELGRRIDRLIAELLNDWVDDEMPDEIIEFFRKKNTRLQRHIRELKDDLESARKFAKMIGSLADIVGLAQGLVA